MKTWIHVILWLTVILTCLTLLTSSCNTIKGMGRDIEKAGEEIQEAAD